MTRIIWISLISLLVTSCTSVTPTTPTTPEKQPSWNERQTMVNKLQSWQINGKIGVQTPQDSGSATIHWVQNNSKYTISLYGPLGSNELKLSGQPGSVQLIMPDGKQFSAATPEQLLSERWGWKLPVANIRYWVRGLPVPGIPSQTQFDSAHRLTSLTQQGWQVQFMDYQKVAALDLPNKISITSPTLKTKIVIYEWKFDISH